MKLEIEISVPTLKRLEEMHKIDSQFSNMPLPFVKWVEGYFADSVENDHQTTLEAQESILPQDLSDDEEIDVQACCDRYFSDDFSHTGDES